MNAIKILLAALAALIVLGGIGIVSADTSTIITADNSASIEITAPPAIGSSGTPTHLVVGPNTLTPSDGLYIATNSATWHVYVETTASLSGHAGRLNDGTTNYLASALVAKYSSTSITLSDTQSSSALVTGSATNAGTTPYAITFAQNVAYNDPVITNAPYLTNTVQFIGATS